MTLYAIDSTSRTELAARENHGISVRLLWTPETDVVTVTVSDSANGDYFELVLDDDDRPLDFFHHPYAHAAARGLEFRGHSREWEVMADAA
jgi:hypothetical protein